MKKFLPHILILAIVVAIIVIGVLTPSNTAGASCSIGINFRFIDCISEGFGWIAIAVLKLVGLITMLAGMALNYVVWYTVVRMADNFTNIPAIETAWGVVRDVANMGFIFVLLYAAIKTILGEGSDTRHLIVNMIIAAILINFSLFFTKVVIDVANLIALTFYKAIAPGAVIADTATAIKALTQHGISNSLMAPMGIASIWNAVGAGTITGMQLITVGVMGSVVALVAAFVFASIAIMFAIRYVVLILVLILSPLMFVAMILPQLQSYTKQWKDALIGQAFFAPVYMLLTWIVIQIINSDEFKVAGGLASAFTGVPTDNGSQIVYSPGGINLIVNFVVIIILLIASLMIAKKVADSAGPQFSSLTKWATGLAGGATLGLAGRAGRASLGALGSKIGDSERLKEMRDKGGLVGSAARLALATGRKTAGASFDVRGTALLPKELDTGKAQKGGYTQMVKDEAKREKEYAESLAPTDIIKDEAIQKLQTAKDVSLTDPKFRNQWEKAKQDQQAKVRKAQEELQAAQQRNDPDEIGGAREKVQNEIRNQENLQDIKNYKNQQVNIAQAKVDKLKGVDDDRAKELIKERMKREGKEGEYNEFVKSDAGKAEIAKLKKDNKSIGDIRKENYIEDTRWVNTVLNPILFQSKGNKQAAAEIRKGKKPIKDQLEGILREAGELPKKEEGEEEKKEEKTEEKKEESKSEGEATPPAEGEKK